jgi:pimeloyl-ACP methyl ester carboxylesterase
MKSVFKGAQAKASMLQWFDRFRERIPAPTESRTVSTRFGDTHVLVGGPENGPSLVVLHGALANSAIALVELAPLLKHFRVYSVDVIGQSVKSADTRPSVSNNDYGLWLRDVLDALSLQKPHVVGVSWGGFVAIRLAACAPERLNRLALLVPAGMVSGPAWAGLTRMALPMMLYVMSPSERRLKAFLKNLLTNWDDNWSTYMGDALRAYDTSIRIPALAKPHELKNFSAPTLVIGADRDLSFPGEKVLARAAELFPSLTDKELIRDCNHCPPTTDEFRGWVSNRLSQFLLAN